MKSLPFLTALVFSLAILCVRGQTGCTDALACNYSPEAVTDDGSCVFTLSNDECQNALFIGLNSSTTAWNTCSQQNGNTPTCLLDGIQNDVWFAFLAPINGQITVWCEDGPYSPLQDTQLALFDACGGVEIACNDDSEIDNHARLDVSCSSLIPGNIYYIQVDGYAGQVGQFILHLESVDISGCTDVSAANYNSCATVDDGSCSFFGCADSNACNYNPNAQIDDGSCCYGNCLELVVTSGLYPTEIAYSIEGSDGTTYLSLLPGNAAPRNSQICLPDGCFKLLLSDLFGDGWNGATYSLRQLNGPEILSGSFENDPFYAAFDKVLAFTLGGGTVGCTDSGACNYNPAATCDDESCDFASCFGCTDPVACNYSAEATQDDGSCCLSNCGVLELYDLSEDGWGSGSYTIYGEGHVEIIHGTMTDGIGFETISLCLPDGCYYLQIEAGEFPEEISYSISGFGDEVIFGDGFETGPHYFSIGVSHCLGCTQAQACNYNPWAAFDNGTCISGPCVAGDNPWTALPITLGSLSNCATRNATHAGATATAISQAEVITGEDIWFRFTAITNAARLRATSLSNNITIELLDANWQPIDVENAVMGPSMEAINIDNLTPGAVYFLGVSDYDSNDGLGPFTLCLSSIGRSGCNSPSGTYSLCSSFKANFSAANAYVFNFMSNTSGQEFNLTVPGNITKINLHQVPNLRWNDTYTVRVDAIYNLTNGAGDIETITMTGNSCTITVAQQTNMVVRPSFACSAGNISRFTTLIADPWVCGSIGAEWEFTDMDGLTPSFTRTSLTNDRRMNLSNINEIQFGRSYQVRIRPIFSYGTGTYGPATCIQIVASPALAPSLMQTEVQLWRSEDQLLNDDLFVYPNPSSGDRAFINLPTQSSGDALLTISNIHGQLIYSNRWGIDTTEGIEIRCSQELISGIYLITFENKGEVYRKKWIVQTE